MNKVVFTGKGGYPSQNARANELLEVGQEYTVVGGSVFSSSSYYILDGFEEQFNTVMFEGTWQDHADILIHEYPGARR
jgi:hypothetical protein